MKVKDYLAQIWRLDQKIQRLMREKEYWRQMAFSITKDTTQPKYNPNHATSAGYERCIEKADALERQITAEIDRLADLKVELTSRIHQIEDQKAVDVLLLRYVELCEWPKVGEIMGFCESWVFKKHAVGLKQVEELLKVSSEIQ